jgi:hypothetical protein
MTDERAVSEVVGFVLVFSLVLGTITVVYVGGFTGLQDTRDHEQMANAERAFDVLANNLQEIGRGKAPSRATEIKLSDATITLDERYEANVTVDGTPYVAAPRSITYHGSGRTKIVYEHGAVIRQEADGAVMIREPDFIFTDERAVLRHISLRGGQQNLGGSTTVLIRAEGNSPQLLYPPPGGDMDVTGSDVNISLQTRPERTGTWKRYLESQDQTSSCTVWPDVPDQDTHETVNCSLTVDSLAISTTDVDVTLV